MPLTNEPDNNELVARKHSTLGRLGALAILGIATIAALRWLRRTSFKTNPKPRTVPALSLDTALEETFPASDPVNTY
jgi:hypothetical protein